AALARTGARIVQAEPHPQGLDVWIAAPAASPEWAVPA
ncbi:methionine ABC transporter ATP-binding protein, partial [Deinococcus sp. 6YEL10]|nr:methionine ABC transporter ATP-binding protein [Deinococcus sp. 6YEL10]